MKVNCFTSFAAYRLNNQGAALITVVAIFAVACILAVSVTSVVFITTNHSTERNNRDQAYLTAKSVLIATQRHIQSISSNREAVTEFIGYKATGTLTDMGEYTATIDWNGEASVIIVVEGRFNGESVQLYALIQDIGGGLI